MVEARNFDILGVFLGVRARLAAVIYKSIADKTVTSDLVQDTFLRIWERRDTLSDVRDMSGYFLRTGRNIAFDHARRSRIAPFVAGVEQVETICDPSPSPEVTVIHRDELLQLQKAIDSLPPRARTVFLMSRMEGLTYAEIGERLGISSKTVFSHMVTALERIQSGVSR